MDEEFDEVSSEMHEEECEEFAEEYEIIGHEQHKGYAPAEEQEAEPEKDWEKEAKSKVHIKPEEPERRKTIYELDSYASSGPSASDITKLSSTEFSVEPPKIRYSLSLGTPGIARLSLSPLTQKIIGCVVGENVSTEYPWIYVRKDVIQDNLELHAESSDFLPVKQEIRAFPDTRILIGYAPSTTDESQFYVCLTEEGRDAVIRHIQFQRQDQESRVRKAVYKTVGSWRDLGSGAEVDDNVPRNTRPLFEIEVVSSADILNAPMNLTDRKANDQRDGYVELLPYRQKFENVSRKLVARSIQVAGGRRDNDAQTTPSMPVNSWFQYLYEYKPIDLSTYSEEQLESLSDFLKRYTDRMCDEALLNATWDIYTNDYGNLVRNEKDTQPPMPIGYKELQSYYDGKLINEKVINDLSWHPFWTGIAIAAYTRYAKSDVLLGPQFHDTVIRAFEGNNYVLVWSFNDCLSPKLILECPREVTAVSTCPSDGSIIIGGSANGQIAIWHIAGMIEQTETVAVFTSAQVKHRIVMRNLMSWMQLNTERSIVRPTAVSSLKYSQKGAITQITWVPSHQKVDENGRITSVPSYVSPDDLSSQFVTSSEDGTIAFWDLKWRPTETKARQTQRKRKLVSQPDALTQSISPFKILDRIFKPDYVLVVQYPDETRRPMITTLSMYSPKFRKEQVEPFPIVEKDITIRRYFRPVIEKPDYVMKPKILIGTVEGDFGCVTWEGFEFSTGLLVNRELCQWNWLKTIHDGPVTHSVRSKYYENVVASVGGKVFAVWREDFGEPLIWKKSSVRYTACSWGSFRPTVLILARADGTVEIWDFIVKSYEPCFSQSLSGRIITGIYTHELYLDPQCVVFCDFNGTLRTFLAPGAFLTYDVADIEWMKKFVDRQVDRISEFKAWQRTWNEANLEDIEMKRRLAEMEAKRKQLEAEQKIRVETAAMTAKIEASKKSLKRRKASEFLEEARARWLSMELKRMQRVILEKKGLRKDVLEKQRAPVLKLRQEVARKKRKIREILQMQDRIFDETVAFLFPDQYQERRRTTLPPLIAAPAERKLTVADFLAGETVFQKQKEFVDPQEEIIYNFLEIEAEALANIQSTPFRHSFEWRKVLTEGKSRRASMDIDLRRLNKPKRKLEIARDTVSAPAIEHVTRR